MVIKVIQHYGAFLLLILSLQSTLYAMETKHLLHDAVRLKDPKLLAKNLEKTNNINDFDAQGQTALHLAAHNNFAEGIRVLVNAGALHVPTQETGQTPIALAISRGNIDATEALIEHGALAKANPEAILALWQIALKNHHIDMVKLLRDKLKHIPQINSAALGEAIKSGYQEAVQELIDDTTPLNTAIENNGGTALHEAARCGKLAIARLLLERGANPEAPNKGKESPLKVNEIARPEFIRLFILYGVNPQSLTKEIETIQAHTTLNNPVFKHPLEAAAATCNVGELTSLIKAQRESFTPDILSEAATFAAGQCCLPALEALLNAGAMPVEALQLVKVIISRGDSEKCKYEAIKKLLEAHFAKLRNLVDNRETYQSQLPQDLRRLLLSYLLGGHTLGELGDAPRLKRESSGPQ